jgi:hemoglobin/transferrin/lactoferrin receptor protein
VSQAFRAPNLSDLTRFDSARSNEVETPAPGLDPEHFTTWEVGLKNRGGGIGFQLAYFYTSIGDMIIRTPTGALIDGEVEVTKKNSSSGYVHGLEAEGIWHMTRAWAASFALTWIDGEVDTYPTSSAKARREPIDRLMPPTAIAGLSWQEPGSPLWARLTCRMAARQDKLSTRDKADTQRIPPGGTPGYVTLDLHGGLRVLSDLSLSLALENLTNADYRIHGSGVNEPGRNLILAVEKYF